MNTTAPLPSLVRALGFTRAPSFGSLWNDPANVLFCLAHYLRREGCEWAHGLTVEAIARECTTFRPYDADGQAFDAMACLLLMGEGARVVSLEPVAYADRPAHYRHLY